MHVTAGPGASIYKKIDKPRMNNNLVLSRMTICPDIILISPALTYIGKDKGMLPISTMERSGRKKPKNFLYFNNKIEILLKIIQFFFYLVLNFPEFCDKQ